jgi:hypothetical protein
MITLTLRPLHLAIIGGFLAGILIVVGVVLASGGGDKDPGEAARTEVTVTDSPTPEASPSPPPAATEAPTAAPEPTEEPEPEPEFRSCAEIEAAGTYNSPAEREFFLENCVEDSTAAAPAASTTPEPEPSGNTSDATAAEELYRSRAEGKVKIFTVQLTQYVNAPSQGAVADILEFGAVLRRFTQELDRLPEPPPRFKQVHDQFRSALIALADHIVTFVDLDLEDETESLLWLDEYFEAANQMLSAMEDYALVVGFELPEGLVE